MPFWLGIGLQLVEPRGIEISFINKGRFKRKKLALLQQTIVVKTSLKIIVVD